MEFIKLLYINFMVQLSAEIIGKNTLKPFT